MVNDVHRGGCCCGAVQIEVSGAPAGLPKCKDLPADFDGSGETLPE
jgi:hypothetical protein